MSYSYSIYQVKEGDETRGIRFEPLERLLAAGGQVDRANYDLVYAGPFDTSVERQTGIQILSELYTKFNVAHPLDFTGRSLSISDVVVLRFDDMVSAHYVDSGFYFSEVPEFLDGPYRYYSTQRPVDIGTFPKTEAGPEHIENYDKRIPVENGRFKAWGHLDYSAPLTEKQAEDYELRAAFDNPDLFRYPPRQLDAQLQVVGKWEQSKRIPDTKRLTWFYSDFGVYVKKEFVTNERLAERFGQVMESKTRAAQNKAEKRSMEKKVQIVGHWEEMKCLPENERFTWHKPSIHAFALREPVVGPEQLERRYLVAKKELTRADEKISAPKRIAEQLKEGAEQAARDNAARPAPEKKTDKDR